MISIIRIKGEPWLPGANHTTCILYASRHLVAGNGGLTTDGRRLKRALLNSGHFTSVEPRRDGGMEVAATSQSWREMRIGWQKTASTLNDPDEPFGGRAICNLLTWTEVQLTTTAQGEEIVVTSSHPLIEEDLAHLRSREGIAGVTRRGPQCILVHHRPDLTLADLQYTLNELVY